MAVALATALVVVGLPSMARADSRVDCSGGTCKIVVENPGTPGSSTPGGTVVPASTGSQMSAADWAAYLARLRAEQKAAMNDASTQVCSGGATYIPQYLSLIHI